MHSEVVAAGAAKPLCVLTFPHGVSAFHLSTQATAYVEFDTAGQSNMYPVVTKAYEAGSDQDTADTGAANTVVGAGAAAIAVAVLALGLGALSQLGGGKPWRSDLSMMSQSAKWHTQ
jgi:hypothetical protein